MSEQESTPYHLAAKFPSEGTAGRVYFQIQRLIDNPEADLSAYRLQLYGVWHVVVVGVTPATDFAEKLEKLIASGEMVELPSDALGFLRQRRSEQSLLGPWVERHYRPGRRFPFRRE